MLSGSMPKRATCLSRAHSHWLRRSVLNVTHRPRVPIAHLSHTTRHTVSFKEPSCRRNVGPAVTQEPILAATLPAARPRWDMSHARGHQIAASHPLQPDGCHAGILLETGLRLPTGM
jgi:hypothetical protein